jgi:hypothetical protein
MTLLDAAAWAMRSAGIRGGGARSLPAWPG